MARKKKCPQCPKSKGPQSLKAFNKNASGRDGRQTYCRECQKLRGRAKTVARNTAKGKGTPTQRAATRAAKAATRANKRLGPAFVVGKTQIPEALRQTIETMAWEVLGNQLKRFSAKDRRILTMYAQAQGVEV